MIKLKLTWKYCIAFYCITMLYMSLHELVHHFAAALVCGEFGYKSFNSFDAACESDYVYLIATLAGPAFSFIMMYVGVYFLVKGQTDFKRYLGFAMIFAQLPFVRMIGPLSYQNDEWYAVTHLWGNSNFNWWLTVIVVWVICLPPLIIAYRSIANKFAILWVLLYYSLLPIVLVGPVFFTVEYLMVEKQFLSQTVIGIGLLFIINEVITIGAYISMKKYLNPFRE